MEKTPRDASPAGRLLNGLKSRRTAVPRAQPLFRAQPALKRRRRRLLLTTVTLERPMAAAA